MATSLPMAVIGTGPAGLGAAWELRRAGHRVTLFERNPRVGGRMVTRRFTRPDGSVFQVEDGPSQIAGSYTRIIKIMKESGMGDQLIPASTVLAMLDAEGTSHDFTVERIHLDMLRTKLISLRDKLDLGKITFDVLRYRRQLDPEDLSGLTGLDGLSAEQYGRRRFGGRVYDLFVDPVIRGFVGTAPDTVAAADLVWVFGTFMKLQKYYAIRDGMQHYAEHVGSFFDQRVGAEVTGVTEHRDQVDVAWRDAAGTEHGETFAGVVIATLATQAAQVHTGLDAWRRDFLANGVDHATIIEAHVGLDVPPASRASMVYSTEVSDRTTVLAVNLEHNKAAGRVPEGKAMATVFGSNDWSRRALEEEDDDLLIKELIETAEPMVPGVSDNILFTHLTRWPWAWSKSTPDYWPRMREFLRISAQSDRLVRLAGDYFCVTSLNVATASGERAARQVMSVRDGAGDGGDGLR
jgi:protoporphyrinogen/coproporphyrinogen III oxidase